MNINDLTIGQAREIAALVGSAPPAAIATPSGLVGKKVIVRASSAGVHFGTLVSIDGDTVTLKDARRLWYWVVEGKKGISLSDAADHGLSSASKICAVVASHIILGAAEVMTTSEAAQKTIESANAYRP